MSGPDRETLAIYGARAAEYATHDRGAGTAGRLARFIAALPEGGTALDLGCGPGWAAAEMVRAGLDVTAMDASPAMAAQAQAQYGLEVRVAPFEALDEEAAYDGVWAHFSLLHAPRAAFAGHLAALRRALRPGGTLVIAMKLGEGEGRDRLGRFYTYYSRDALERHLSEAGFDVDTVEVAPSVGFDGTPGEVAVIFAHG
ncbi:SAM-dependent methyltransferase [Rhodovulum iodosum]|uniref:SAM-dependent methyltransferase n=1 Tax=Rhodovulum iodosum TaxID=68291 RepID=A0ABV3XSV0_9RHOB|nr:class I SAM-dependent methyltransferase [Rhodovulum robiginosum]RSK39615.1 class I SAM-dependent methyltransferase [Rhodovulum robiginosum]